MNIGNFFFEIAKKRLDSPAITFEEKTVSYKQLAILVEKWSDYLSSRITKDDRVLCVSENCPEIMAIYLAVAGLGGVFVPINPQLTKEEINDIFERSTPTVGIFSEKNKDILPQIKVSISVNLFSVSEEKWVCKEFEEFEADKGCLICFTSGSTGKAKGIYISHQNEYTSCFQYSEYWDIQKSDKVLVSLPQSFLYGLTTGCLMALFVGAQIILEKKFHPIETLNNIEKHQVTVFMGVPTMYTMMLDVQSKATKKYNTSSIQLMLTAGAPLANEIFDEFKSLFSIEIVNFYALSEIRPIFTYNLKQSDEIKRGSCGRKVKNVEVKLLAVDGKEIIKAGLEGEIVAKSDTLMLRYYDDLELTENTIRDGWFYTGDLGMFDANGYFYITGRKKELVIRGGINISPVEIEEILYKNPAILEAVIVGVPDEIFGEELFGQIVLKEGNSLTDMELREFLNEHLASYKVPKYIEFSNELPKNNSGKIDKKKVKAGWGKSVLQQHN
ncbi:class I adenylate-forming enzyme family protein [Peribacillus frigoritolerans]|uniref:class I adenylate-forming enzyme family protein n=1 Tax=Peribacillus frigoritolerans TaxID=450367 RepID=UPI0039A04F31